MAGTVRDVVWLGVSNGKVIDYWTDQRRNATKVRRQADVYPVTTLQVHRGIWERAMKLAGGDAQRIRVHSATHVEVVVS